MVSLSAVHQDEGPELVATADVAVPGVGNIHGHQFLQGRERRQRRNPHIIHVQIAERPARVVAPCFTPFAAVVSDHSVSWPEMCGAERPQDTACRSPCSLTHVARCEGSAWRTVHRHAIP